MAKEGIKTFPLKLESILNRDIDACVFYSNAESKQQYILDALKEKVERDKIKFNVPEVVQA